MKIFHVQRVKGIGGSERHLLSLLSGLESLGIHSTLAVLASGEYLRFIKMADAAGVSTVVIQQSRHLDLSSFGKLTEAVRQFEPDLLHTHLIHADLYGTLVARVTGIPRVMTIHGPYPQIRGIGGVATRITMRSSSKVIAISDFLAGFLKRYSASGPEKVDVIHYGAPLPTTQTVEYLRVAFRNELRLTDEVVVGVAARLIRGKGHEQLIRSFAVAVRSNPGLRLFVAGDGPLLYQLQDLARELLPQDSYRFFGHVEEVEAFMSGVDIMCFPTVPEFVEGFGLAALEAMSLGRPVIASDTPPLPEVVAHGSTGLLVPPGDIRKWATALQELARNEPTRAAMSLRARERTATVFPPERMVNGTKIVYESVLANPGAGGTES